MIDDEARCVRCGGSDDLGLSVQHHGPGAYNVEPVFVCEECKLRHEKNVSTTTKFRKFAPRETWSGTG